MPGRGHLQPGLGLLPFLDAKAPNPEAAPLGKASRASLPWSTPAAGRGSRPWTTRPAAPPASVASGPAWPGALTQAWAARPPRRSPQQPSRAGQARPRGSERWVGAASGPPLPPSPPAPRPRPRAPGGRHGVLFQHEARLAAP